MIQCGKNIKNTRTCTRLTTSLANADSRKYFCVRRLHNGSFTSLLFLPHFDVICHQFLIITEQKHANMEYIFLFFREKKSMQSIC